MGESCGGSQALRSTGATGLEPATSGVTGRRSNQLSYAPEQARPQDTQRNFTQVSRVRLVGTQYRIPNGREASMRHRSIGLAVAIALGVMAPAAFAAIIDGTAGHDRITGTPQADSIDAQAGPDLVR